MVGMPRPNLKLRFNENSYEQKLVLHKSWPLGFVINGPPDPLYRLRPRRSAVAHAALSLPLQRCGYRVQRRFGGKFTFCASSLDSSTVLVRLLAGFMHAHAP